MTTGRKQATGGTQRREPAVYHSERKHKGLLVLLILVKAIVVFPSIVGVYTSLVQYRSTASLLVKKNIDKEAI